MTTKLLVISLSLSLLVITIIPTAQAQTQTFPRTLYSVWDGCGVRCGVYLGQFGPDNLTGSDTTSTSVTIQIIPQYQPGPNEVPITGYLCSLDNAVPSSCGGQVLTYTNLHVGAHTFKAIWTTAVESDPNPPVFTWKIIAKTPPPPPTLRNQIITNTWAQLCKVPTVGNSPQGRLHCH